MYKLLFDSDALIKSAKISLLKTIVEVFSVITTEEVYNEAVIKGKERLYEDAHLIEELINSKKIEIVKKSKYKKNTKPEKNLGEGEISVYQAYKGNFIIVTDDLYFIKSLDQSIKQITTANIIPILVKKKKLSKNKAKIYLERLKPYIKRELYKEVYQDIRGRLL